ncbi:carbohydrate-binding protein [Pseudopedobacter beijingensis]|uniref:Carbohydrate-binding protein n=1 Tax=Pseudopedobacter beijingensis TaxID=1207056 RepID=A0ABW4I9V0_9SPHI
MKKLLSMLFTAILFTATQVFSQDNTKRIEAENFSEKADEITVKPGDKGTIIGTFSKGAWVKFEKVNFEKGAEQIKFRAASGSDNKPQLEIRLGDAKGKLLGTAAIENEGWGKFKEYIVQIPKTTGEQTITIISPKGGVILNWFEIN